MGTTRKVKDDELDKAPARDPRPARHQGAVEPSTDIRNRMDAHANFDRRALASARGKLTHWRRMLTEPEAMS
jgi:hypothetical protein